MGGVNGTSFVDCSMSRGERRASHRILKKSNQKRVWRKRRELEGIGVRSRSGLTAFFARVF